MEKLHVRYLKSTFAVVLFILTIPLWAQSYKDFTDKYTEVYLNLSDTAKAFELAHQAFEMLETNESLQEYANYFLLHNIFKSQLNDSEMAERCIKKANSLLTFDQAVEKPETYDTPALEWLYEYQMELYKQQDPAFGKQALNFLQEYESLWNHTNFSSIAAFFERIGDFQRASKLYERGLSVIGKDTNEVVSLYPHANFLFRSGDYQKVEELILLNDQLLEEANAYTKLNYQISGQTIRMFYNLYIGDYANYIKNSERYYDFIEQQQTVDLGYDAYAQPRLTNRALGQEFSGQWAEAYESWLSADSAWKAANSKLSETYPNYPVYYYSMASWFKAKTIGRANWSEAIKELDVYYETYAESIPLSYSMRHQRAQQYAFYHDDRYHEHFQAIIRQLPRVRDYTESTKPLTNYAYFLMRDGHLEQAFETYQQLFGTNVQWINDLIFIFGEKAFVAYYANKIKEGYDNYHSFVKRTKDSNSALAPRALELAYNNLLLTKSIAFKGVRKRKKAFSLKNSPEVNRLYKEWISKKQDLIRYYQVLHANETNQESNDTRVNYLITEDSLETLQDEVDRLANRLATEARDFQSLLKISTPDWKETRKRLNAGEAAVEMVRFQWRDQVYYSDTSFYAAYIIRPDSKFPEVVYLPEIGSKLDNRHYQFYKNAIRFKLEDQKSFNYYWKPIGDHLKGLNKVYFSPDGIYHMISLPTLLNPETGNYLLDEINIRNVNSTEEIGGSRKIDIRHSTLFGRPAYEHASELTGKTTIKTRSFVRNFSKMDVSDLPGTEEEVVVIEQLFKENQVDATSYLGRKATESEFYQVSEPDILHIATHGYWSETEESTNSGYHLFNALVNSGLLLSGVVNYYQAEEPAFTNDGILTAYEAQNLQLETTDLVVLSACETGLGTVNAGEGVYGLQRAFRTAGADNLITSLWKVDDAGTRDFMIAFYKDLLLTKDIGRSFRHAQQQIQEKYQHPYYWGAFVLFGDG